MFTIPDAARNRLFVKTMTQPDPNSDVSVVCQCGKSLKVPAKFAGKAVKCPACQTPIRVPGAEKPASSGQDDTFVNRGLLELLDEAGFTATRTGHRCPSCRAELPQEAVICVECGYNFETGRTMSTRQAKRPTAKRPPGAGH
jgi:hypothetical protein